MTYEQEKQAYLAKRAALCDSCINCICEVCPYGQEFEDVWLERRKMLNGEDSK